MAVPLRKGQAQGPQVEATPAASQSHHEGRLQHSLGWDRAHPAGRCAPPIPRPQPRATSQVGSLRLGAGLSPSRATQAQREPLRCLRSPFSAVVL